ASPPPKRGGAGMGGTGVDGFASSHYRHAAGKKLGGISNPTGGTPDPTPQGDVMHSPTGGDLVAVFGPQHGVRRSAQTGGTGGFFTDPETGLPVYSLDGSDADQTTDTIRKAGVDLLAFDIQDVGTRFYTYIWTMYYGMVAAARLGIGFL